LVKILKFFDEDPGIFFDPGSGIRDGKILIRDKHPGSATLRLPTCAEDVDSDPGPRHEADGQAGQTKL
jgi:hypothetical protein